MSLKQKHQKLFESAPKYAYGVLATSAVLDDEDIMELNARGYGEEMLQNLNVPVERVLNYYQPRNDWDAVLVVSRAKDKALFDSYIEQAIGCAETNKNNDGYKGIVAKILQSPFSSEIVSRLVFQRKQAVVK